MMVYLHTKLCSNLNKLILTVLHSEQPKLHRVLAVLSAIGLSNSKTSWHKCCAAPHQPTPWIDIHLPQHFQQTGVLYDNSSITVVSVLFNYLTLYYQ